MNERVEKKLWEIYFWLCRKHISLEASKLLDPLKWYVGTGRSTLEFDKRLVNARTYMIGRILEKDGSVQEVVDRVKKYLGVEF